MATLPSRNITKRRLCLTELGAVLTSPLRYPGGKSRGAPHISKKVWARCNGQLLSPFVGGGSVELNLASQFDTDVVAYDSFGPLVDFWQCSLSDPRVLADRVESWLYPKTLEGKDSFYDIQKMSTSSKLDSAARFFALNRSSHNGTTESGGCSTWQYAEGDRVPPGYPRFTLSSIDRLRRFRCPNLSVEQADFKDSLSRHKDLFAYLDPPYMGNISQSLYGTRGSTHKGFDHDALYEILRKRAGWILSYDNSKGVKKMYSNFTVETPEWAYGMGADKKSRELLIFSKD